MSNRTELAQNVTAAQVTLSAAVAALDAFDQLAENNVFASLKDAERLEDTLECRARDDCEGAGNCGNDEYRQEFLVDGVKYVAIYKPEYNRHDKTYYYIDGGEFKIEPVA